MSWRALLTTLAITSACIACLPASHALTRPHPRPQERPGGFNHPYEGQGRTQVIPARPFIPVSLSEELMTQSRPRRLRLPPALPRPPHSKDLKRRVGSQTKGMTSRNDSTTYAKDNWGSDTWYDPNFAANHRWGGEEPTTTDLNNLRPLARRWYDYPGAYDIYDMRYLKLRPLEWNNERRMLRIGTTPHDREGKVMGSLWEGGPLGLMSLFVSSLTVLLMASSVLSQNATSPLLNLNQVTTSFRERIFGVQEEEEEDEEEGPRLLPDAPLFPLPLYSHSDSDVSGSSGNHSLSQDQRRKRRSTRSTGRRRRRRRRRKRRKVGVAITDLQSYQESEGWREEEMSKEAKENHRTATEEETHEATSRAERRDLTSEEANHRIHTTNNDNNTGRQLGSLSQIALSAAMVLGAYAGYAIINTNVNNNNKEASQGNKKLRNKLRDDVDVDEERLESLTFPDDVRVSEDAYQPLIFPTVSPSSPQPLPDPWWEDENHQALWGHHSLTGSVTKTKLRKKNQTDPQRTGVVLTSKPDLTLTPHDQGEVSSGPFHASYLTTASPGESDYLFDHSLYHSPTTTTTTPAPPPPTTPASLILTSKGPISLKPHSVYLSSVYPEVSTRLGFPSTPGFSPQPETSSYLTTPSPITPSSITITFQSPTPSPQPYFSYFTLSPQPTTTKPPRNRRKGSKNKLKRPSSPMPSQAYFSTISTPSTTTRASYSLRKSPTYKLKEASSLKPYFSSPSPTPTTTTRPLDRLGSLKIKPEHSSIHSYPSYSSSFSRFLTTVKPVYTTESLKMTDKPSNSYFRYLTTTSPSFPSKQKPNNNPPSLNTYSGRHTSPKPYSTYFSSTSPTSTAMKTTQQASSHAQSLNVYSGRRTSPKPYSAYFSSTSPTTTTTENTYNRLTSLIIQPKSPLRSKPYPVYSPKPKVTSPPPPALVSHTLSFERDEYSVRGTEKPEFTKPYKESEKYTRLSLLQEEKEDEEEPKDQFFSYHDLSHSSQTPKSFFHVTSTPPPSSTGREMELTSRAAVGTQTALPDEASLHNHVSFPSTIHVTTSTTTLRPQLSTTAAPRHPSMSNRPWGSVGAASASPVISYVKSANDINGFRVVLASPRPSNPFSNTPSYFVDKSSQQESPPRQEAVGGDATRPHAPQHTASQEVPIRRPPVTQQPPVLRPQIKHWGLSHVSPSKDTHHSQHHPEHAEDDDEDVMSDMLDADTVQTILSLAKKEWATLQGEQSLQSLPLADLFTRSPPEEPITRRELNVNKNGGRNTGTSPRQEAIVTPGAWRSNTGEQYVPIPLARVSQDQSSTLVPPSHYVLQEESSEGGAAVRTASEEHNLPEQDRDVDDGYLRTSQYTGTHHYLFKSPRSDYNDDNSNNSHSINLKPNTKVIWRSWSERRPVSANQFEPHSTSQHHQPSPHVALTLVRPNPYENQTPRDPAPRPHVFHKSRLESTSRPRMSLITPSHQVTRQTHGLDSRPCDDLRHGGDLSTSPRQLVTWASVSQDNSEEGREEGPVDSATPSGTPGPPKGSQKLILASGVYDIVTKTRHNQYPAGASSFPSRQRNGRFKTITTPHGTSRPATPYGHHKHSSHPLPKSAVVKSPEILFQRPSETIARPQESLSSVLQGEHRGSKHSKQHVGIDQLILPHSNTRSKSTRQPPTPHTLTLNGLFRPGIKTRHLPPSPVRHEG